MDPSDPPASGSLLRAPFFAEEVRVVLAQPVASGLRLAVVGVRSGRYEERLLAAEQLAAVEVVGSGDSYGGDARRFLLAVEALRLGLAYEYDPYFALSVSRVDPLPHQLEAVYQYFLALPRIRFLLADDPGAGKTIMAGLLLRELKARGLVRRVLIVTPANLMFQWQRELQDRFRERFEIVRGEVLRSVYGHNPWHEKDQVIASISWISRIPDARESLLRAGHWDLVVVDEAHKMSAASRDKKTYAYQLGEALSERCDHLLLMTATPHKGDPVNFCLFLELLDKDVYGDVKSLEEAMRRNRAPFYLRRTKEALVSFPDPETGQVQKLFRKREVETVPFELSAAEWELYEELTRYVEEQSEAAAEEDTPAANALRFTMAMLQRRFASSVYACRKSLERMRERRQKILADPEAYLREQQRRAWQLPEDADEWEDEEREAFERELEEVVVRFDPTSLRREIARLEGLIAKARALEAQGVESKLGRLKRLVTDRGLFGDPTMKLLVFTEHRDTLEYLAGDGREGRPLGWLRQWGLAVSTIHGGMKVGDRDTPGTRLFAEREFRERTQILVATEAAGEGINLQFCWLLVNYDIPWNPVRLEQRMGRIHRYGQEHDVLAFNFVAHGTREGRVLQKLLARLAEIRKELGTDQVFDVVGEVFPGSQIERMFRDLYARKTTVQAIEERIVRDVNPARFLDITQSALEGLATRELNLAALMRQRAEMKERRLVPEVVERFFLDAAPEVGLAPRQVRGEGGIYRVGRLPRGLLARGEELEPRFGRLGREYAQVCFDKAVLAAQPTAEWVTPGHPLFEAVRAEVEVLGQESLRAGTVLYDPDLGPVRRLDIFAGSVVDGTGAAVHRRLFVVEARADGSLALREPTVLLDLLPAAGAQPPSPDGYAAPEAAEAFVVERALLPLRAEVAAQRAQETERVERHAQISLEALIQRAQLRLGDLLDQQAREPEAPGLAGQLAQAEQHLVELNRRLEGVGQRLALQRQCTLGEVRRLGSAWVLPHPGAAEAAGGQLARDDEVELIAMEAAMAFERSQGWEPEDVHEQNRGYDILSRHPQTGAERAIEVKGCGGVDAVMLTRHEHETARKLGSDYWLYVVYNCDTAPEIHRHPDPARLAWEPVRVIERWRLGPEALRGGGGEGVSRG
jgi:superfamily II DNA or RNA helicase